MNLEALTADEVASLLDKVSDRQVRTWVKDKGMPCRKDGRSTLFAWAEVLPWYVEYKASLARYASREDGAARPGRDTDQSRDPIFRKDSAVAALKELDLEQRQGQLVRMGDVLDVFGRVVKDMQTEVRSLPTRIVQQALAITDRDEMVAFLTDETNHLLTRLSQLRFDQAEPEGNSPESEGNTAEPDDDEQ